MIRLAHGPVVDALKRYDSGLRVRWSHEKQKWAVEARALRRSALVPPVFYERIGDTDQWIEHILPVLSERYLTYHAGTYVICWTKQLDQRLLQAIWSRDSARMHGGMKGQLVANLRTQRDIRECETEKRASERSRAGYDYLKHLIRTRPELADGTGISTKGIR